MKQAHLFFYICLYVFSHSVLASNLINTPEDIYRIIFKNKPLNSQEAALTLQQFLQNTPNLSAYSKAMISTELALIFAQVNKEKKALELLNESKRLVPNPDYTLKIGSLSIRLAISKNRNNFEQTIDIMHKAKALSKLNGDKNTEIRVLIELADIYLHNHRPAESLKLFLEATNELKLQPDPSLEALLFLGLGKTYIALNDYEKSILYTLKAFELFEVNGDKYFFIESMQQLADAYLHNEQLEESIDLLNRIEKLNQSLKIISIDFFIGMLRCQVYMQKDRLHEAENICKKAYELINFISQPQRKLGFNNTYIQVLFKLNNKEKTNLLIEQNISIIGSMNYENNLRYFKSHYSVLAKYYEYNGQFKLAAENYKLEMTTSEKINAQLWNNQIAAKRVLLDLEAAEFQIKLSEQKELVSTLKLAKEEQKVRYQRILIIVFFLLFLSAGMLIVNQIKKASKLKSLANTDVLTDLPNRRAVFDSCEDAIQLAKLSNTQLTLVIFDIDFFKAINDQYGHVVGDFVLKQVGSIIKKELRNSDIFGRVGGEEFLILLKEVNSDIAFSVIERARETLNKFVIHIDADTSLNVTASFGLASFSPKETLDELYDRADRALYDAKSSGRNISVWAKDTFDE